MDSFDQIVNIPCTFPYIKSFGEDGLFRKNLFRFLGGFDC